jgi:hypothetical protein
VELAYPNLYSVCVEHNCKYLHRGETVKLRDARRIIVSLLIVVSVMALTQALAAVPSYAQAGVDKTHPGGQPTTQTHGPPTTNTVNTTAVFPPTANNNGNGRHGNGIPPGLVNAWAKSNMSVVARAVTHAIFLNGTHGVELAEIAINSSSNGQLIRNVAFNESVAEIQFDHDGSVELTVNSSAKPSAVFADDMRLGEASSTAGLNANSNAWIYDQNDHVVTIFADPSSVTLYYGSEPTPMPEFQSGLVALMLVGVASATILLLKKRPRTRAT